MAYDYYIGVCSTMQIDKAEMRRDFARLWWAICTYGGPENLEKNLNEMEECLKRLE